MALTARQRMNRNDLAQARFGKQPAPSTYKPGAFTVGAIGRGLPAPTPLKNLTNNAGAFAPTAQSSFGGSGSSTGFMSPTAKGSGLPKYANNPIYNQPTAPTYTTSQQTTEQSLASSQVAPAEIGISGAETPAGGEAPLGGEASGAGTGSGTTGAGAGGYTPPGLGYMEEEKIDTEQPTPSGVQAQPFTQPGGAGAISAGGTGTSGTLASKYEQGFNAANSALATMGGTGGQLPSGTSGASLVNQYAPGNSNSIASTFVKTDPFIEGLVQSWQQYISPQNQRASLAEAYQTMIKDSGIQALDTELLNMKNVIEGSEDDLRTEITKAGGFATQSQILGLTNARNRQLIKNYNTLLDTRNAKEKYLQTAIQLEQSDRESADRRFESAFSMGTQLATMQQQMQTNARTQMQWLTQNLGFDGLYDSAGGDPYTMGLIEQTLGMPQGGLAQAANQARLSRAQAKQDAELDRQIKQQQIKTPEEKALDIAYKKAQISNIYSEIEKRNNEMFGANGIDEKTMGKIQASPEYKTINGVLPAIQALKAYRDAINKYGTTEVISGEGRGTLKGTYGNALATWKTLAGLGALSGADFTLAENAIPSTGFFKRKSTSKAKLDSSINNAITQAESLTKRLQQNYPVAAAVLSQQLDEMKVTAYPDRFVVGDDGLVYEVE